MAAEHATEVLVVGAGPVGLLTALLLAEQGVQVEIIDQEEETTARSYACALHPRSLKILERVGLAREVIERGYRVGTIAFYEGQSRCAELQLAKLSTDFPFLVVLPQSELESLLEGRLAARNRSHVNWNHRLTQLQPQGADAIATIDKLGEACTGYLVSALERLVVKTFRVRSAFVVGADGHNSVVRRCLNIPYDAVADAEYYAVHEFEAGGPMDAEGRIVLDANATSVCWPLSERRCRWSCQVAQADVFDESQPKQRRAVLMEDEAFDATVLQQVREFIRQRAPWFEQTIKELDWSATIQCERRLTERFGSGRCWLAGDAAHRTGPVGVHSMNVGLCEAEELADTITSILRKQAPLAMLESYNTRRRNEWRFLLGLQGGFAPTEKASPWVRRHAARLLACLPASGDDLAQLGSQLELVPPWMR